MSKKITDEDIENGVAKVERMNKAFDKAIIPVLFIAALSVFLFGALPKLIRNMKETLKEESVPVTYVGELTLYEKRSKFMDELDINGEKIQEAGYKLQPEVQGIKSISKQYDDQTVIAHFYTGVSSYGKVIREDTDKNIRSDLQINIAGYSVTVTLSDASRINAKFTDSSFTADETLTGTDSSKQAEVLLHVTSEELNAMLAIYDAELASLVN